MARPPRRPRRRAELQIGALLVLAVATPFALYSVRPHREQRVVDTARGAATEALLAALDARGWRRAPRAVARAVDELDARVAAAAAVTAPWDGTWRGAALVDAAARANASARELADATLRADAAEIAARARRRRGV